MKKYFLCSLVHEGILGGGLIVEEAVTYRTNKLTVNDEYRNLRLSRNEIVSISWKLLLFPIASFHMQNGNIYTFLIFNKYGFMRAFAKNP